MTKSTFIVFGLLFLAIVVCQVGPTDNPSVTQCKPMSYCILQNGGCNSTNYCDPMGNLYCDSATSKCLAKKSNGVTCSLAMECLSGYCSTTCQAPPTVQVPTTTTPFVFRWESESCNATSICYYTLFCSPTTNKCTKKYTAFPDETCSRSDECRIGNVCANLQCKPAVGGGNACTSNSNCSALAPAGSTSVCYCTGPDAAAGTCAYQDAYVMPLQLVSTCQSVVDSYRLGAPILENNKMDNEYQCILKCQYAGSNSLFQMWKGKK